MYRFIPLFFVCAATASPALAQSQTPAQPVRVATFNIAMGFDRQGEMAEALEAGGHPRLLQVAETLQRVRPDIVLLNEFDYDPDVDAAALLMQNYLADGLNGQDGISYPWHFSATVNTGEDSGLDLDGDGKTGGPGDAWGFGHFPGQYGMLVLSRYPLLEDRTRTFQQFPWSALPGARQPLNPDGSAFYPPETWQQLRLSSKSHWDLVFNIDGQQLHLLAHHPTPPVFDGPENRNGLRNYDENRFWKTYYEAGSKDTPWLLDDTGRSGGIAQDARFVIAGDFNADPLDGDSVPGAMDQLLDAAWINNSCLPASSGAAEASRLQGGLNEEHSGNPALDTSDFNDRYTGNLRLDYLLPSANLQPVDCGVFWPAQGEPGHQLTGASDHRLVWIDLQL